MFYLLAAIADLILALLHLLAIFIGAEAYIFLRAGQMMADADQAGAIWPALLTLFIVLVFVIWSFIGFWAARFDKYARQVRVLVALIGAVFVLRGSALVFQFFGVTWFSDGESPLFRDYAFSSAALIIGALHLYAAYKNRRLGK